MNKEQTSPQDNQPNKFNVIEEAVSRINAENRSSEFSNQLQWKTTDTTKADLAQTITPLIPINAIPATRSRLQFIALGMAGAAMGAAITWGLIKIGSQPKIVSQTPSVGVDAGIPTPNWPGLQMSHQLGDARSSSAPSKSPASGSP